jgi:hypothetical protein
VFGAADQSFSAGWQGGEYLNRAGLWVGAIGADGNPHVSTVGQEFAPEEDPRWILYTTFEGAPGGGRTPLTGFGTADDDNDGQADEDFLNGLDDDGDGATDEDFEAIGQQMFTAMYRDDTPASHQVPEHIPLNLLVRQRSFQWSITVIDKMIGMDFEVVNEGDQRLDEVYVGFYSDSDAGPKTAQYTSVAFGKRCKEAGVEPSMGSVGDAYDNAMAESFFATLECELLDRTSFRNQIEARMAIFDFIEGWYNPLRRHSGIGYESPSQFEARHEKPAIRATGQEIGFHTGSQSHDLDPS